MDGLGNVNNGDSSQIPQLGSEIQLPNHFNQEHSSSQSLSLQLAASPGVATQNSHESQQLQLQLSQMSPTPGAIGLLDQLLADADDSPMDDTQGGTNNRLENLGSF